jgi:hypothetical protein
VINGDNGNDIIGPIRAGSFGMRCRYASTKSLFGRRHFSEVAASSAHFRFIFPLLAFTALRLKPAQFLIGGVSACKTATSLPAVIQKQGIGVRGMAITVIAQQMLLYGHIIAFALALATTIKEDVHLLRAKRIDSASLHATANLVKWLLLALWVTGVPMVMMDIGTDVSLLLGKPKLLAKLIVVGALTLNGILLHLVAFPMVTGKLQNPNKAATIAATLGAVSITSWLYASFVAVSRIVAPYFSVQDFVMLYLLALAMAVSFAILVVRDRLKRMLIKSSAGQGHSLSAALLEAEIAMLALSDIQRRLRTNHLAQQFAVHQGTSSSDKSRMTARKQTPAASDGIAARTGGNRRSPQITTVPAVIALTRAR